MATVQSFEIRYETAPDVPPPYCYYYHVQGTVINGHLQVAFQWIHHHREQLTEAEITDEGFTANDNFEWQGDVDLVWLREFEKLLPKTHRREKLNEADAFLEIRSDAFTGTPHNAAEWEYFAQELIQGIYEIAGKEASLVVQFKQVMTDKTSVLVSLTFRFSNRTVQGSVRERNGNRKIQSDWDKLKSGLAQLYSLDYLPENALPKEPNRPGTFVDPGENVWYELGKGANNPSAKRDVTKAVMRFFMSFTGKN